MQQQQEIFAVCSVDAIANQRCKSFVLLRADDRGRTTPWQIMIVRRDRQFYGYVNRCPHQKSPLNFERDQFFDSGRKHLMCGKHGALFDIATGACVDGPCLGQRLEPVDVLVADGDVCVAGVRLVEDDGSDDADETMDIMIHPD